MVKKLKKGKKKEITSFALAKYAVSGIEEKKGSHIACINLKKIPNSVTDYFVICQADSRPQVEAIARSIEENIKKKTGERPRHIEGLQNAEWVLLDYITMAVHIFRPEIRKRYNLEELWADADIRWIDNGLRRTNGKR